MPVGRQIVAGTRRTATRLARRRSCCRPSSRLSPVAFFELDGWKPQRGSHRAPQPGSSIAPRTRPPNRQELRPSTWLPPGLIQRPNAQRCARPAKWCPSPARCIRDSASTALRPGRVSVLHRRHRGDLFAPVVASADRDEARRCGGWSMATVRNRTEFGLGRLREIGGEWRRDVAF